MNKENAQNVRNVAGERSNRPTGEREQVVPIAKIRLLYESRDGRLCLFEDAEGHLTAVRSAILA